MASKDGPTSPSTKEKITWNEEMIQQLYDKGYTDRSPIVKCLKQSIVGLQVKKEKPLFPKKK